MNKLQLSVFTITLLALLSSVFLFAFVTDSQTNSKATAIHAKDGKELLSQAYYLEESELDLDEKLQDFKNASLLLISLCFSFLFLLCCLGLSGFPITTTFIGEDLVFSHIHSNQLALAFFVSASFIIDGLAIVRIYARVFLGPHVHSVYEMGYRSS